MSALRSRVVAAAASRFVSVLARTLAPFLVGVVSATSAFGTVTALTITAPTTTAPFVLLSPPSSNTNVNVDFTYSTDGSSSVTATIRIVNSGGGAVSTLMVFGLGGGTSNQRWAATLRPPVAIGAYTVEVNVADRDSGMTAYQGAGVVIGRSTSTSVSCPASQLAGTANLCTVTVTDTSSSPQFPGGTVNISTSGASATPANTSCSLSFVSGNVGDCTVSITGTSGGTLTVTASYSPSDGSHIGSSGNASISLSQRTTQTVGSCTPNPQAAGTTSNCTVTVTDTSPGTKLTPTGQVAFNPSGVTVTSPGTCTLSGGSCTFAVTSGNPGMSTSGIQVAFTYNGDGVHASSGGTTSLGVRRVSSTSLGCPSSAILPATVTCNVRVDDVMANSVTPDGTVHVQASGAGVTSANQDCTLFGFASSNSASCSVSFTVTASGNLAVTATYAGSTMYAGSASPPQTVGVTRNFTITASAGANGTITPSGTIVAAQSSNPTFSIAGNANFQVGDVLVDGASVGAVTSYTFTNVQSDHTIAASFVPKAFTLTSSAGAGGSIAPSGATSVNYGTSQPYTITPNPGFRVLDVLVDAVSVGAATSYSFTNVTAPHTIAASFKANTRPGADDKTITTNEDSPVSITLSGSDAETAPANLAFNVTAAPLHGLLSGTAPNVLYTPAADYNGVDTFRYTVSDRGDPDNCSPAGALCNAPLTSAEATVTITVNAVNDAPVANAQTVYTDEDTPVAISLAGSDIDSPSLSFSIVSPPTHGAVGAVAVPACIAAASGAACSAAVTYTPAANFNGSDSFTFKVNDGSLDSLPATVFVNVASVDDAPSAASQTVTTNEDTPIDVILAASDIDSPSLAFSVAASPSHGTLGPVMPLACVADGNGGSLCTAKVTYVPGPNYDGADSFAFTASDGSLSSAAATVGITVTPVNDPPEAMDRASTLDEDTQATIALTAVDIDSTSLGFSIVSAPAHGILQAIAPVICTPDGLGGAACTANVTYVPAPDYNGPDSFTYKANDAALDSNVATVTLTVAAVNDAPTAQAQSVSTPEDTPLAITLGAADIDSAVSSFTVVSGPAHGVLGAVGPITCVPVANGTGTPGSTCSAQVLYAPAPNYNGADDGPDGFVFAVSDGALPSNAASVAIQVTAVEDPPSHLTLALSASAVPEGGSVTASGAFTDPDESDSHTVAIDWGDGSSSPATLSGSAATGYSYTATHTYVDDNPSGTASDVYTVVATASDSKVSIGTSSTITVNNVAPVVTGVSGPVAPLQLGSGPATVVAKFTDAGVQDTHACSFDWDDGSTSPGTIAESNGAGTCTGIHSYTATGVYEPRITLVDDDGGQALASFRYVAVYDPSAGFVTGGGWIDSPPGAYAAKPGLTGKANFGFNARYPNGSRLPTGDTQFQFNAAGLGFQVTGYDWLVISGPRAQYKGSATLNGAGGYSFLLTAIDGKVAGSGGVDRFRIKIWGTASGAVVYDNVRGAPDDIDTANPQALGGGSITIHK